MEPPKEEFECLQSLVRVTAVSEAAFHAAAAAVRSDEAQTLLLDRAYRFGRAADAFRSLARARGVVEPVAGDETFSMRSAGDDLAVLAECEKCEDAAIVAVRDALEASLPSPVRRTIEREFDGLLARLGTLRGVRERLERHARTTQPV